MITLCGFALSNYYNKVKIVLLEKGIAFEEVMVKTGSTEEAVLGASPLGKVPFIRTSEGTLCESQVIVDYLEAAYPQTPLMPSDPFAAAKVRELCTFMELHLELSARELYGAAFFGGSITDSAKARVHKTLERHIVAFKRLVKFAPYAAGETFTLADCAAYSALPALGLATKTIYGVDLLEAHGVDYKSYLKLIGERPSVARVAADRKAQQVAMAAAAAAAPAKPPEA